MHYIQLFFIYLAFTVAIEMASLFLGIRYILNIKSTRIATSKIIITGFISVLTLPFVWFVFPNIINNYILYVVIAEVFAVGAEGIFYRFFLKINWWQAIVISFICNLASFLFGLLVLNKIFYIFGG